MPTHGTTTEQGALATSSHWPIPNGANLNVQSNCKPKASNQTQHSLADVAFLDIRDVCAAARMSASWIHDEVRMGRFPQPLRFGPRCSRWRSSDVRDWLISRAASAEGDAETATLLRSRAKKASDAAQAKRHAAKKPGCDL
jgi:predicted DNA-binding transcriptional regulator AlpA